jgi:anti-anti-sigma regulatory factor
MDSVSAEYRDDLLVISVSGRFTLPFFKDFYTAYKGLQAKPSAIDIDLAEVESIDGIGFGMLLSMRNYFGSGMPMRLRYANESVLKNLRIARLDKHFEIDT